MSLSDPRAPAFPPGPHSADRTRRSVPRPAPRVRFSAPRAHSGRPLENPAGQQLYTSAGPPRADRPGGRPGDVGHARGAAACAPRVHRRASSPVRNCAFCLAAGHGNGPGGHQPNGGASLRRIPATGVYRTTLRWHLCHVPCVTPTQSYGKGRLAMQSTSVTCELQLRLVVSSESKPLPVPAGLRYDSADPYAVHASFHTGGNETVDWAPRARPARRRPETADRPRRRPRLALAQPRPGHRLYRALLPRGGEALLECAGSRAGELPEAHQQRRRGPRIRAPALRHRHRARAPVRGQLSSSVRHLSTTRAGLTESPNPAGRPRNPVAQRRGFSVSRLMSRPRGLGFPPSAPGSTRRGVRQPDQSLRLELRLGPLSGGVRAPGDPGAGAEAQQQPRSARMCGSRRRAWPRADRRPPSRSPRSMGRAAPAQVGDRLQGAVASARR